MRDDDGTSLFLGEESRCRARNARRTEPDDGQPGEINEHVADERLCNAAGARISINESA